MIGQGLRRDWEQGLPARRLIPWYVRLICTRSWSYLTSVIVFAGKDASRALGKTSTKPEDVKSEWHDLDDKEKETLNDWITFFSKRYNIVGVVDGATNME